MAISDSAAARLAFEQDFAAEVLAGHHEFVIDTPAADSVLPTTRREFNATYQLPTWPGASTPLPEFGSQRECVADPNGFIIDIFDEAGDKRSQADITAAVAAATAICSQCVQLGACQEFGAKNFRRQPDPTHIIVVGGLPYAQQ